VRAISGACSPPAVCCLMRATLITRCVGSEMVAALVLKAWISGGVDLPLLTSSPKCPHHASQPYRRSRYATDDPRPI
jgi:hypothetical protein